MRGINGRRSWLAVRPMFVLPAPHSRGAILDLGLADVRDARSSMRGNNNDFFMERVFPRMGRVTAVDDAVRL